MKGRRQNDNISIAYTKSSKTLKSKLNNNPENQPKKIDPPYFKGDPIVKQITERAYKKGIKGGGLHNKNKSDHLRNATTIVKELFERHKATKEKLQKLKQQAQKQKNIQCPFQPQKRKFQKYLGSGVDVVRRNEIWLQQKKKKRVQRKQSQILEDLTECTFSPTLISKKQSQFYLKNRSTLDLSQRRKRRSKRKGETDHSKGQISKDMFEDGKKQIARRILTMY